MKWFQHQARANRDTKLKKVLMKYGAEGYGLYWYCIEHICDNLEPRLTFELEHDSEILAHELKIDTLRVEEMMRYMVTLGLFERSGDIITCMKLARHLGDNLTRNPELKEIIQSAKGRDEDGCAIGYIYFIQDGKKVKVGYSQNPWSRLKDVKSKHHGAALIGHFRDTVQEEKEAHRILGEWHSFGEWFELPADLIGRIDSGKIGGLEQLRSQTETLRSSTSLRLSQQEERTGEEKKGNKESRTKRKRFIPPTEDEVSARCFEMGYTVCPARFWNYYESVGWKVGKNPMKDWHKALAGWQARDNDGKGKGSTRDSDIRDDLTDTSWAH